MRLPCRRRLPVLGPAFIIAAMPHLSVIIPCLNELKTVRDVIARVHAAAPDAEIVLVDDGSTDGTRALLAAYTPEPHPSLRLFLPDKNGGPGAALHTGFEAAPGQLLPSPKGDLE